MTEDEARTKLDALGARVRSILQREHRVAHVLWEPGNMTQYEFLFVPWSATTETEWDDRLPPMSWNADKGTIYIARFGVGHGRCYPLKMWEGPEETPNAADVTYCAEKWGAGDPDGAAVHLLFSAVAGIDPRCTFEDASCRFDAVA